MNWIIFALMSPLIFTAVFFVDKYVLEREVPDHRGMPIYFGLVGMTFGVILWNIQGQPSLPIWDTALLLAIGMIAVYASVLYFYVINREDTSTVIVFLQVQPLMVLVLSFIFLDEVISARQLLGFFLILGAAVGMTLSRTSEQLHLSFNTFALMMLLNLGMSITSVLFKFVSEDHRFWDTVAYEAQGNGVAGITLMLFAPVIRKSFLSTLRVIRRRALGIILLNESFVQAAKGASFRAISLGPVALVRVIGSTQVFIGILIGWILTVTVSSVFKEDISRSSLTRKLSFASMMFVGVVLLIV